jgi:hypothetical protein
MGSFGLTIEMSPGQGIMVGGRGKAIWDFFYFVGLLRGLRQGHTSHLHTTVRHAPSRDILDCEGANSART